MGLETGLRIGKYELGKKLGEGGFGLVFVARDTELDREVALKFMHAAHTANPEILRRFLQEARSAAKIVHPGIVTVFECSQIKGTDTDNDGIAYIAMELLHGESLSDRVARGKLSPAAAMEIVRQTASALEAAHRAGIIHRDLKPDNIFLVKDPAMPGGERVKVLDFGIAKLAQSQGAAQTQSQVVFGTPRYMSPEQCRSAAGIDHRSDIYALGCILFELVCGEPPFSGEIGELIAKHLMVEAPTARSINPTVPEPLDKLIGQLLSKEPGERPQTMQSLVRTLESNQSGAISAGEAPTLLPDAAESLQRFTPPHGVARNAAAPTTLHAANASKQIAIEKPAGKRTALLAGLGILVIAGGITAFALTRGGGDRPVAHGDSGASGVTPPPPPPTPPTPKDIEIELTSTPKARVYLVADGRRVGETPYKTHRPPAEGELEFVLKADGFKDETVVVPADHDTKKSIALTEIKPATPGSRSATVAIRKPPTGPKPGTGSGVAKPPGPGSGKGSSGHIDVYPDN